MKQGDLVTAVHHTEPYTFIWGGDLRSQSQFLMIGKWYPGEIGVVLKDKKVKW